ncbi:MAG: HAD hydrolase-like protein [Proteobacteria bacterium]|nr:HAD hydrolase-like protein [Pseudomonadota bacterium]
MDTFLFDLDGTLVDSHKPILQALNNALTAVGLEPIDEDDLSRHIGPPLQVTLDHLLNERDEDTALIPLLIETYRSEYRTISITMAVAYPGIADLLASLDTTVRLGVVTSKPIVFALPILETLGFSSIMEVIEGPDTTEIEPKTITMTRAITRLARTAPLDDLTMIGDRRHDIEAGAAHGARTIGVTWGFGTRHELISAGADLIVDDPAAITALPRSLLHRRQK